MQFNKVLHRDHQDFISCPLLSPKLLRKIFWASRKTQISSDEKLRFTSRLIEMSRAIERAYKNMSEFREVFSSENNLYRCYFNFRLPVNIWIIFTLHTVDIMLYINIYVALVLLLYSVVILLVSKLNAALVLPEIL